jgi:hypothetical protein
LLEKEGRVARDRNEQKMLAKQVREKRGKRGG